MAFSHGYSLCHRKPCPHSSPPWGGAAWRGSCHVANGRLWNGLAPSPQLHGGHTQGQKNLKRTRLWCTGMLGHLPWGRGRLGGAGGCPGAEAVSAHVGTTGKGGRSGLPAEAETTGRSPYGRCQWGQAGVPGLSSPLLLSTVIVVFCIPGPRTQSREEARFLLTPVSAYHFYPSYPDWKHTPSTSLPPPHPHRASLPSHIQSLPPHCHLLWGGSPP